MKEKSINSVLVVLGVFIAVFFAVNVYGQENNSKEQNSSTVNLEKKDITKPEGMKIFAESLDLSLPKDREAAAGALWFTTSAGEKESIQILLDKGVDVNTQTPFFKWTPLHIAAQKNDKQMVKFLISKGADVNAQYVVSFDIDNPPDNVIESIGVTPLCAAVIFDSVASAKILLKNGANVNGKTNLGQTPLSLAKSDKMKKLLIKYGAKQEKNSKDIDEEGSMKKYNKGVEFYNQGNYR